MGHGKSQNALKMGRFGTKNGSKMGEKRVFPKVILDHSGCSNKWFGPILSPWCQTKGYGEYTARAASLHRVKELSSALQFHDMSEKRPKKAPKSPKNLRNAHQHPETKHGAYLGLRGSNPNSEGT